MALTLAALVLAACDAPPKRDCFARVWVDGSEPDVVVRGSWDGWAGTRRPEPAQGERLLRLDLPPGEHQYLLERGNERFLDPANPLTSFRASDGLEVSSLLVDDCSAPAIRVDDVRNVAGKLRVEARFLASTEGDALDPSQTIGTVGSNRLRIVKADPGTGELVLEGDVPERGKHTVRLDAHDTEGRTAAAPRIVSFTSPVADRPEDGIIYQIVVDRFRDNGGVALAPPTTPGARAGGTLDGVRAELEAGTFDALGVSTLWLSPVVVNPVEAMPGADGHLYEGYHGYWPVESREVDPRLGGEAALDALVSAAHARGIRVLLDHVPNHVHVDNPRAADPSRFSAPGCVCGTETCPWSEHIEDCWFTPYLPDVRFAAPGALALAAEDARYWNDRFDLDGFRIDAVPMMPRATTRRIAAVLRKDVFPRNQTFLLGEVFTGPGVAALDGLAYYLGPSGLDSVFDFPLMWALRNAIASGSAGFEDVEAVLAAGEARFAGSGAVMAHMLDNHDTTRFLSVANGDADRDPWGPTPSAQPSDPAPYRRLELGLVAIFTLPGAPVVYYGDEVGLAGGGDPDSRRVFPAESSLSEEARAVRTSARRLGALRRCSAALRRGTREPLHAEPRTWAFARSSGDEAVYVMVNASTGPSDAVFPPGTIPTGSYVDALDGTAIDVEPGASVAIAPLSARVLVAASSSCLDAR